LAKSEWEEALLLQHEQPQIVIAIVKQRKSDDNFEIWMFLITYIYSRVKDYEVICKGCAGADKEQRKDKDMIVTLCRISCYSHSGRQGAARVVMRIAQANEKGPSHRAIQPGGGECG